MNWLTQSLYQAFVMFWATFWALVVGFAISGALQVYARRDQMSRAFGDTNLRSVTIATLFGAASSSCSYAAAAAGRSAVARGAALVPALAFMFASTNLVVELGALLWLLMGWQFVLAEVAGSIVLIGTMWLLVKFFMPKSVMEAARRNAEVAVADAHCCHGDGEDSAVPTSGLRGLASAFVADWQMLWKEILAGFVIAGFLTALVPPAWWRAMFVQHGPIAFRMIENAMVAPFIAAASFICSCGNIPLASVLWSNGISFGGVISFIYADLIVVPLVIIYAKYYGARAALYITAILYASMVIAGLVIDLAFSAFGLIPKEIPVHATDHMMLAWNYTTWLDIAAAFAAVVFFYLHLSRSRAP